MNLILALAWRNLWRRPRRTAILLSAVSLGVWAMICLAALARGSMEGQIDAEIANLTAHAQIHAPGYLDDPSPERSMPPPSPALLEALSGPGVRAWSSRVRVPAVVQSERESLGVTLVGIDPASERGLSFIPDAVAEGSNLASSEDDGVLLGRRLAERLETGLGRRVVLMSQDSRGRIAERGVRVRGIFHAAFQAVETGYAFTGRKAAQGLLSLGGRVSEIALLAPGRRKFGPPLERIRSAAPELDCRPWTELKPLLVLTEKITDSMLRVWFVVIFLAMSFGFVNTMLMAVHERSREIALLQALGMPPVLQLSQILAESAMLLALGLLSGNALAWAVLYLLRGGLDLSAFAKGLELVGISPVIRPSVSLSDYLAANGVVSGLGLLASLFPAWRATRRIPMEALTRG
jgi:ABC-type lipoprotein release transport system permease subunit